MPKILLPTPLRPFADGAATIDVDASTVGAALSELVARHPQLRKHLFDDAGQAALVREPLQNDEDVRYLEKEAHGAPSADSLSIVPSIAGGAPSVTAPAEAAAAALSNEEIRRYSRHLIMPEVGIEGQKKLKNARVLCVGAGGLGSPLALYLAAAGVGTIGIVDFDVVDDSNLQRQILYGTSDVGRPKLAGRGGASARHQPERPRRPLRDAADSCQRARDLPRLRRRRRRHRQLPDALPGQRRLRPDWASPTSTPRSSASRGRRRCSGRSRARATGASTASRRRRVSCRPARRAACWGFCPGSSASSRPPRRSS